MTALVPTNPTLYRLVRLRRMIVTSVALPVASMGALFIATGGTAFVAQPAFAVPALLIWLVLLTAILLVFPKGTGEALVYSLALSGLVLLSPLAELLAAQVDGPLTPGHWLGLAFLSLVAWIGLIVPIARLFDFVAPKGPRPMVRRKVRLWVDLPPEEVQSTLRTAPERTTAMHRSGPADAEGRIPIWVVLPPIPPGNEAFAGPPHEGPHYWVKVLEETPTSFSTIAAIRTGATETTHTQLTSTQGGTVILQSSLANAQTVMENLVFWLGDMMTDHLVATLDCARNHAPPRAIWHLPVDTPALWLTRKITSVEFDPFV
jgi:hypothetical protein